MMIELKKPHFKQEIIFYMPLCFTDYVKLQLNAKAVMSNSVIFSEESSILGFPGLDIRRHI